MHDDLTVKCRVDAENQGVRAKMPQVHAKTYRVRAKTPRVDAKLNFCPHPLLK